MQPSVQEIAQAVIERLDEGFRARIVQSSTDAPRNFQKLTLDLTTERLETDPFTVGFPFRSVAVEEASDTTAYLYLKPHSRDSGQEAKKLRDGDSLNIGNGVAKAFLHHPAQAGKSITLIFFVDADFKSGRQVNVNSGGVSINDGSAFATSQVALAAGAATLVLASDTSRKVAYVQNTTVASVFRGASTVTDAGANKGIEEVAGNTIEWRNTAALYLYTAAGGSVTVESHS
jgi:hypothetical protein